jgi:hypothetical protein
MLVQKMTLIPVSAAIRKQIQHLKVQENNLDY